LTPRELVQVLGLFFLRFSRGKNKKTGSVWVEYRDGAKGAGVIAGFLVKVEIIKVKREIMSPNVNPQVCS
jgi:hypothetical protein